MKKQLFQLFGIGILRYAYSELNMDDMLVGNPKTGLCVEITGNEDSECIADRCTLTSELIDCSDIAYDAISQRYFELRSLVVEHLQPGRACRGMVFPERLVHNSYDDLLLDKMFAMDPDSFAVRSFQEGLLECLGGSTSALRALISLYLEIPGVGWDLNFSYYGPFMKSSHLPVLPEHLDMSDINKVKTYSEAHELVRFTDEDYEIYGEAILEALDQLDYIAETNPELEDFVKTHYAWLYGLMMQSAVPLRPSSSDHVKSLVNPERWIPIRYRSPVFNPLKAYSRDDRMAILTRNDDVFTGIFNMQNFGVDFETPPNPESLAYIYDRMVSSGLSYVEKSIILTIYADMIRQAGFADDVVIPQEHLAVDFIPRPEHYLEAIIILAGQLQNLNPTPHILRVPSVVFMDFMKLVYHVGLEDIEVEYMEQHQKYSLGYFGPSYTPIFDDSLYEDCEDLKAYAFYNWLIQMKDFLDMGPEATGDFISIKNFDDKCRQDGNQLFPEVERITHSTAMDIYV